MEFPEKPKLVRQRGYYLEAPEGSNRVMGRPSRNLSLPNGSGVVIDRPGVVLGSRTKGLGRGGSFVPAIGGDSRRAQGLGLGK